MACQTAVIADVTGRGVMVDSWMGGWGGKGRRYLYCNDVESVLVHMSHLPGSGVEDPAVVLYDEWLCLCGMPRDSSVSGCTC